MERFISFTAVAMIFIAVGFLIWYKKNRTLTLRNVVFSLGMLVIAGGMLLFQRYWSVGFALICAGAVIFVGGGFLTLKHALRAMT